jgi:hypothetical protein
MSQSRSRKVDLNRNKKTGGTEASYLPFVRALALVSINIIIWQSIRNSVSESWDKLIYVSSIGVGIYAYLTKSRIWKEPIFYGISLIPISLGIFGVETHGTQTTSGVNVTGLLWLGFGPIVFIVLILFLPFIYKLTLSDKFSRPISVLIWLVTLISITLTGIGAWQTTSSIIDPYSSEYVINESLAVAAGHLPYVDFIPQYGTMYAFLAAPFAHSLNPNQLVNLVLVMMYIITWLDILIGIYLVYRVFQRRSLALAALWVIPFTALTHLPNRKGFAGSIFDLINELPVRIFPGMVIGALTIALLTKTRKSSRNLIIAVALGIVSGFSFWLNQDFALLAGLIAVVFVLVLSKNTKISIATVTGYISGIIIYPILISATGKSVNFKFIGFFDIQYSHGFMSEPIRTPGPILVILPMIVACAVLSSMTILKSRFGKTNLDSSAFKSLITSAFFAIWCLGGFIYYLNRSYASGQMQILFLPLSVALASIFSYLKSGELRADAWMPSTFFKNGSKKNGSKRMVLIVLAVFITVPFATTIALPDPNIELKRINHAPEIYKWPRSTTVAVINNAKLLAKDPQFKGKKIAYFGASGNYVQLATGIESANILNSPFDISVTQTTVLTGCQAIAKINPDFLLLGAEGPALFRFQNNSLCGVYYLLNVPGYPKYSIAGKIKK